MPSLESKRLPTSESWAYFASSLVRAFGVLVATVYLRMHDKIDSIETVGILGGLALGHQLASVIRKKGGTKNAEHDS